MPGPQRCRLGSPWCNRGRRRGTRRRRTPTRPRTPHRRLSALRPARVDELVARYARRENPRAELATPPVLIRLGQRHPTRVDVDLLAGLAVSDRDRRTTLAEAELGDREPVQRRV